LSIAREIIEEHAGHIDVETELGRGTRFVVRLPRSGATEKTS
jgi:signal transduction histidine kinase